MPHLPEDPCFALNPSRVRRLDEIDGAIEQWCAGKTYEELAAIFNLHDVPFSKVYDIEDVMRDPHFQAREAIIRLPDPDLGSVPAPCVMPRFSGYAPEPPRSGPATGERNEEIYGALGLDANDLERLKSQKII